MADVHADYGRLILIKELLRSEIEIARLRQLLTDHDIDPNEPLLCANCGKAMADHDALAHCWGPESKTFTACNCMPNGPAHAPTCPSVIDGSQADG